MLRLLVKKKVVKNFFRNFVTKIGPNIASDLSTDTTRPSFVKPLLPEQRECDAFSNNEMFSFQSIRDLQENILRKNTTVEKLVKYQLERIACLQDSYRMFITPFSEEKIIDYMMVGTYGEGVGVFYHIKDYKQYSANVTNSRGSLLHVDKCPLEPMIIDLAMKEKGATPLGHTENRIVGARNPYDPDLTAGGSSSGAAVAVACGIGSIGFSNDGAGSIRIPASINGLVGVKPSSDLVLYSQNGSSKNGSGTCAHGVISRIVEDAAIALDMITDNRHSLEEALTMDEELIQCLGSLKIACLKNFEYSQNCEQVERAFMIAAEKIEKALNVSLYNTNSLGFDNPQTSAEKLWIRSLQFLKGCNETLLDTYLQKLLSLGRENHTHEAKQDKAVFDNVIQSINQFFKDYDVLLTPTLPVMPWNASFSIPYRSEKEVDYSWNPYTYIFNWSNNTAITIPISVDYPNSETIFQTPIGLQIVVKKTSNPGKDLQTALKVARALEIIIDYDFQNYRPSFKNLRFMDGVCCKTF